MIAGLLLAEVERYDRQLRYELGQLLEDPSSDARRIWGIVMRRGRLAVVRQGLIGALAAEGGDAA